MILRRSFITGLVSFVAAPAIVRVGSLMPVKTIETLYGVGPASHALTIENIINAKRALRASRVYAIGDYVQIDETWWRAISETSS